LGEEQALGSSGEVALLGHRDEDPKVAQFGHGISIYDAAAC
jgi:hypothetical protein